MGNVKCAVLERPDGSLGKIRIYHAMVWYDRNSSFAQYYDGKPGYYVCGDGVYYVTGSRRVYKSRGNDTFHKVSPVEYVFGES
jgi:hypothetical protein